MDAPALPLRRTTTGDFFDAGAGEGAAVIVIGARLVTNGAANASAQIVDNDGTVLYDLAAIAGYADECYVPVRAVRKVTLGTLTGAGAAVTLYLG